MLTEAGVDRRQMSGAGCWSVCLGGGGREGGGGGGVGGGKKR